VEEKLINRFERRANASQTIGELEFFSLQLEQEFIKIRKVLDVRSRVNYRPNYYLPIIYHKYCNKLF